MTNVSSEEQSTPSLAPDLLSRAQKAVPVGITSATSVVNRALGSHVIDVGGREVIDFASGIGVLNLGHNNPQVVAAVHEQVDRYLHQCVMVSWYEPYIEVCERLARTSPWPDDAKSMLVNSGAEAIENAVKIARFATGRRGVIAFHRGFHGRTMLALALTGRVRPYKYGFGPFPGEVFHAPAPYPYWGIDVSDALRALDDLFVTEVLPNDVACIVVEPVQGEAGIVPLGEAFLNGLAARCERHGILLVVDEIQCGLRRTGPFWAYEASGIAPDIIVTGKALGGGFPLAAVIGRSDVMDAVPSGGFGGTFNGHPVSCAASNATLSQLVSDSVGERVQEIGARTAERLAELKAAHDCIGDVRVAGAMIGIELVEGGPSLPNSQRAEAVVAAARDVGVLVLRCGVHGQVVRLLPPLTISDDELDEGLMLLRDAFAQTEVM